MAVTSLVISGFADAPFDSFMNHAAARLGRPTEKDVQTMHRTRASLREELLVEQVKRHCDEIARIMAPDGVGFAAIALHRFAEDEGRWRWLLCGRMNMALRILAERFTFRHDLLPPDEAVLRIEVDGAPSVVQLFALQHK